MVVTRAQRGVKPDDDVANTNLTTGNMLSAPPKRGRKKTTPAAAPTPALAPEPVTTKTAAKKAAAKTTTKAAPKKRVTAKAKEPITEPDNDNEPDELAPQPEPPKRATRGKKTNAAVEEEKAEKPVPEPVKKATRGAKTSAAVEEKAEEPARNTTRGAKKVTIVEPERPVAKRKRGEPEPEPTELSTRAKATANKRAKVDKPAEPVEPAKPATRTTRGRKPAIKQAIQHPVEQPAAEDIEMTDASPIEATASVAAPKRTRAAATKSAPKVTVTTKGAAAAKKPTRAVKGRKPVEVVEDEPQTEEHQAEEPKVSMLPVSSPLKKPVDLAIEHVEDPFSVASPLKAPPMKAKIASPAKEQQPDASFTEALVQQSPLKAPPKQLGNLVLSKPTANMGLSVSPQTHIESPGKSSSVLNNTVVKDFGASLLSASPRKPPVTASPLKQSPAKAQIYTQQSENHSSSSASATISSSLLHGPPRRLNGAMSLPGSAVKASSNAFSSRSLLQSVPKKLKYFLPQKSPVLSPVLSTENSIIENDATTPAGSPSSAKAVTPQHEDEFGEYPNYPTTPFHLNALARQEQKSPSLPSVLGATNIVADVQMIDSDDGPSVDFNSPLPTETSIPNTTLPDETYISDTPKSAGPGPFDEPQHAEEPTTPTPHTPQVQADYLFPTTPDTVHVQVLEEPEDVVRTAKAQTPRPFAEYPLAATPQPFAKFPKASTPMAQPSHPFAEHPLAATPQPFAKFPKASTPLQRRTPGPFGEYPTYPTTPALRVEEREVSPTPAPKSRATMPKAATTPKTATFPIATPSVSTPADPFAEFPTYPSTPFGLGKLEQAVTPKDTTLKAATAQVTTPADPFAEFPTYPSTPFRLEQLEEASVDEIVDASPQVDAVMDETTVADIIEATELEAALQSEIEENVTVLESEASIDSPRPVLAELPLPALTIPALPSPIKSALRSPLKNNAASPKKTVAWVPSSPAQTEGETSFMLQDGPLSGLVFYVDVHTGDGKDQSDLFVPLLEDLGGQVVPSWSSNAMGVTHVLFKDGDKTTLEKVVACNGTVKCVNIGWAIDCEKHNKHMDESSYLVNLTHVPGHTPAKPLATKLSANKSPYIPRSPFIARTPSRTPARTPSKYQVGTPAWIPLPKSAPTTPRTLGSRSLFGSHKPAFLNSTTSSTASEEDKENSPEATKPYFLDPKQIVQRSAPPKKRTATDAFSDMMGTNTPFANKLMAAKRRSAEFEMKRNGLGASVRSSPVKKPGLFEGRSPLKRVKLG